jgi:hypothetical protein
MDQRAVGSGYVRKLFGLSTDASSNSPLVMTRLPDRQVARLKLSMEFREPAFASATGRATLEIFEN